MITVASIIERDELEVAYTKMTTESITKENNRRLQQTAKEFIARAPQFAKAYVRLGWLQMLNKEYEEAEQNFKTGLELDPHYGIGYYNYLYFLVEVDRYEEAEAFIPVCLKVRSINTRLIYEEWDVILEQTGRVAEAIEKKKERIANTFDVAILKALEKEIHVLKEKIRN